MTRTGNELAKKQAPEASTVLFIPVDHPLFVQKVVRKIQPRLLLIAETELWPNLILSCKKRRTPIIIFNGRISERSFPRYRLLKFFFRNYLGCISLFLMQTDKDRRRITEIGAFHEATKVMGNIKFDQTPPSFNQNEKSEWARSLNLQGDELVIIAGSTHSGEEEILLDLFKELDRRLPRLVMLLAPRHLDRLEEVERLLKRENLDWKRKSSLSPNQNERSSNRIILLDTMGELMSLYSLGSLVFIGGSLVPVGGHNPLEPLFFKKCVLFGPHMFNFVEISRLLVEAGGAIQVNGREEFLTRVKELIDSESLRQEIGDKGHAFLQNHRGATERIFEEIKPYLVQMRSAREDMGS